MTSIAALSAGLATSIHCIGMCGPLACSLTSRCKTKEQALLETLCYHVGRILSYTLIGALAGFIGKQPLGYFFKSPAVILPWIMVAFLLLTAFPQIFKAPRLSFLTKPYYKAKYWASKKPSGVAGGLLGLFSPCLPCTPLYLIFGVSLLSGSPLSGARIALCFSIGTVPLLWLAQSSTHRITKWIPGPWRGKLRSAFLLVVTAMLVIRLQGTLPFAGNATAAPEGQTSEQNSQPFTTPESTTEDLPSCCQEK